MQPLPLFYMGNIAYFKHLRMCTNVVFDVNEHFIKQSYRTRCCISTANGSQNLIIPVHKKNHTALKDVTINYSEKWTVEHKNAIKSAYKSASYFEDYAEPIFEIIDKQHNFLVDLNLELTHLLLSFTNIEPTISQTTSFVPYAHDDLRIKISPKIISAASHPNYYQLFEERHGFLPNLSLIDLLFNEGPESIYILD